MNKKINISNSFKFALNGIRFAILKNRNMKIHIAVAVLVIVFSYVLGVSRFEGIVLSVMIVLVITSEMMNTVVEEVVGLMSKEYRIEAKIAKDVGAGTVLLTAIMAAIVGFLIFFPYIQKFLY